MEGFNTADTMPPLGSVQTPPASGTPPSEVNISKEGDELHADSEAFIPASGCIFSVTVTVAELFAHGAMPITEYVYTPGAFEPGT